MARTFQFDDFAPRHSGCIACEEMFADAIDGLLSSADQTLFDLHLGGCTGCMDSFAQAQRGAAWLDLLKTQRPEPSGDLLERILARTAGEEPTQSRSILAGPLVAAATPSNVVAFRPRPVSRFTRMTRLAMEPRLAMTAAMAFFSIALTMNLVGVRFDQIKSADLKPSNLKRTYYETSASAARYYDNLRVVRVLESRVDDLREANSDDRPSHASPESRPEPHSTDPNTQPEPKPQKNPNIPGGSSRRESPLPVPTLLNTSLHVSTDRLRRDTSSPASFKKEGGLV